MVADHIRFVVVTASAWAAAVAACSPSLRRVVRAWGVASAGVEDVVQEVWRAALARLQHGPGIDGSAELAAWLCDVVRHKAVDAVRRAGRERAGSLDAAVAAGWEPADPRPGPAEELDQQLDRELARAVLDELRQADAMNARVIELRFLQEQSAAEVAAALGLSEEDVRVRQFRTIRMLRRKYKAKEEKQWRRPGEGG